MPGIRTVVSSLFIGSTVFATTTHAELAGRWAVGAGDSLATIQFDFLDGDTYVFDFSFDEAQGPVTGQDVIEALASDDLAGVPVGGSLFDFEYEVISYSFGDFLVGIGIDDSYHYGDGSEGPDYVNYWHYWTRDSSDLEWSSSMVGFGSRVLTDGVEDAWVFGTDAPPSVVPLPGTLAIVAGGLMLHRRRCRATTEERG